MGKKLYVGNLAFSTTEESVNNLFSQHGTVDSCQFINDRDTGRFKGFCFVVMSSQEEAADAISSLDGQEMDGRSLKVNEARPKPDGFSGQSYSRSSSYSRDEHTGFKAPIDGRRSSY